MAQTPADIEAKAFYDRAAAAFEASHYQTALETAEKLARRTEKAEAAAGKTRERTAQALSDIAWYALFTRQPEKALSAARRALRLAPDTLLFATNEAHALLFLGRTAEAIKAYTAHKGETIPGHGKWDEGIAGDFAEFRKRGLRSGHYETVQKALRAAPDSPEVANAMALQLFADQKYAEARPLFERSVEAMKARYGAASAKYASALNNLGLVLAATGASAEAESLYRRALAIWISRLGRNHPQVATGLNNLAGVLLDTNRRADAERLYRRALAIDEQAYGPDHPSVAGELNNLADLLTATGQLAEAEALYRRVLAIDAKIGAGNPNAGLHLGNLATLLFQTNRAAEAEPLYRLALASDETVLGADHPRVAKDLDNLAGLLWLAQRFGEAEPLYRRALAIYESRDPDSPDVANTLDALAMLLRATGRTAEAEPLYRRALALGERYDGPDGATVARRLGDLAWVLRSTNRSGEAEPLYRRALGIAEKRGGPDDPDVAKRLSDLAGLLQETGRSGEAEALYRRALAIAEKHPGPGDSDLAERLADLAGLLRDTKRPREAEPLYRRALAIAEKTGDPDPVFVAAALKRLALLLQKLDRLREAETLLRRVLAIAESSSNPDNAQIAVALGDLGGVLRELYRLPEAEGLYRRALAIDESYGKERLDVARDLNNLAELLQTMERFAEAEPLLRQALAIDEKLGVSDIAVPLNNLAALLKNTNRFPEAEQLWRRALTIWERDPEANTSQLAIGFGHMAMLLQTTNRLAEAETLYLRALAIHETSQGPDHPLVARDLHNLAQLLQLTNRFGEAEPLHRRSLGILENRYGANHPDIAVGLHDLGRLLEDTNRLTEAETLYRRALTIWENSLGTDHTSVAACLASIAGLLSDTRRLGEAEALYRRAWAIDEHVFGPDHPNVAWMLNHLGEVLRITNRPAEAEAAFRRALAIDRSSYGPDHPNVARELNNLAELFEDQGNWATALTFRASAKPILIDANAVPERQMSASGKAVLMQNSGSLRAHARALYRADAADARNLAEGFELAQWALQNPAADALATMSARFAAGDANLANLVRKSQDVSNARGGAYRVLDLAVSKADRGAAEAARKNIAGMEAALAEMQEIMARDFPNYAALANPRPLSLAGAQALLGENQALVLFADLRQSGTVSEETLVFALTRSDARWASVPLGTNALQERVARLRCGLDEEEWVAASRARRCGDRLGLNAVPEASKPLPFNIDDAYGLYRALFGDIEELVAGKQLIIVPSGPLTGLPFQVLVTQKPDIAVPASFEGYGEAAWLIKTHAVVTLPSVASLDLLRRSHVRQARAKSYAGFGNPLLKGDGAVCRRGANPDACASGRQCQQIAAVPPGRATIGGAERRSGVPKAEDVFAGGASAEAVLKQVRALCPLPDTACEIRCVGERFDADSQLIRLDRAATKADIKTLSESGELARYGIVHFATHGLLAGDVATLGKRQGEPALVLTPPNNPANGDDNGLLLASDVAELKLNADWVVLSACNTAAGDEPGAEALSGLARAFFYAGARALLVSHWPVYSDAAVRLTTQTFNELDSDPNVGRAEALQRAIMAMMNDGSQADNAHPAVWAPFVVAGEGGR